jgi:hypothetical protein
MRILRKLSFITAATTVFNMLFFLLYFLFLWLTVDLRLIYQGGGIFADFPVFYRGWEFFSQTVSQAGGLLKYVNCFLAQLFCIGWLGALIAAAQAWLLWVCSTAILKIAVDRPIRWVGFAIVILLLVLYCNYIYPLPAAMGTLTAFAFAYLYLRLTSKKARTSIPFFIILSIILFVIAGAACFLFAIICAAYELFFRRKVLSIIFLLSAPLAAYIMSIFVFNVYIIDVIKYLIPQQNNGGISSEISLSATYAFYLLLPVSLIVLRLMKLLFRKQVRPQEERATAASVKNE